MTIMTTNQISGMVNAQQAMFGNFASYATQITPPYASMGGQQGLGVQPSGQAFGGAPMGGGYSAAPPPMYSASVGMGPAPPPPPMPQYSAWNPYSMQQGGIRGMIGMGQMMGTPGSNAPQVASEALMGNVAGGMQAGITGLNYLNMGAGLASMVGVGGMGMAAAGGLPVMAGIAAAGYGVDQFATGLQQRQKVNRVLRNRFGGQMGVGSGSGGMGFSTNEMGQISTMVREMGSADMFTNMDELTRIMDKTAQMGLYRGVESAKEFRKKFKDLTGNLKEIAKTMGTTMEEATQFLGQGRSMGFFSGKEINANLIQATHGATATGMGVQQVMKMQQAGTQMGRALGMRGKTGAVAMREMGLNVGMMMQTGALSDEMVAEATGGLQGAEGAQALSQRMMEVNARFMRRGAGRVMLAGLWNQRGGIDQGVLRRLQSGEMNFGELRQLGRRNIAATGGRRSEFFSQQERIAGEAQAAGGGTLMLGALEEHFSRRGGVNLDDPIMQRRMRRMLGVNQGELEAMIESHRNLPAAIAERRARMRQSMENTARTRAKEGKGLRGKQMDLSRWWEQNVENKFRQAADDIQTSVSEAIQGLTDDMEGTIKMQMSSQAEDAYKELMMFGSVTGQRKAGLLTGKDFQQLRGQAMTQGFKVARGEAGTQTSLVGRFAEATGMNRWAKKIGEWRGGRPEEFSVKQAERLGLVSARMEGEGDKKRLVVKDRFTGKSLGMDQVTQKVQDFQRAAAMGYGELGFTRNAFQKLATEARIAITDEYGSEPQKWTDMQEFAKDDKKKLVDKRIRDLRRQSRDIDRAFSKFEGDSGKQMALLRELESESGIGATTLRSDFEGAIGMKGGFRELETTMEGLESMEASAFRTLAGAQIDDTDTPEAKRNKRKVEKIMKAMNIDRVAASRLAGVKNPWEGSSAADRAGVGADEMKTLWRNEQVKEKMLKWRFGTDAEKQDAASQLLAWANQDPNASGASGDAPKLSEDQRTALKALGTVLKEGSKRAEFAIGRLARIEAGRSTVALQQRDKELAIELQERLQSGEAIADFDTVEGGQAARKELLSIQAMRKEGATFESIAEKERAFMEKYGQDKEIMGILGKTKGTEYLYYGMQEGRRVTEWLTQKSKKGVGRTQRLIEASLKTTGLGAIGRAVGKEAMGDIAAQLEAGETDEAMRMLQDAAEGKGISTEALEKHRGLLTRMFKSAEGGVTDEEAKEFGLTVAGGALGKMRVKGAKREVMATSELQGKIFKQLQDSHKVHNKILGAVGQIKGVELKGEGGADAPKTKGEV